MVTSPLPHSSDYGPWRFQVWAEGAQVLFPAFFETQTRKDSDHKSMTKIMDLYPTDQRVIDYCGHFHESVMS